jgi:hypothetical protein
MFVSFSYLVGSEGDRLPGRVGRSQERDERLEVDVRATNGVDLGRPRRPAVTPGDEAALRRSLVLTLDTW